MQVVHKRFLLVGLNTFVLPKDSRILSVQVQKGVFTMWYMCDPVLPPENRQVYVAMTGEEMRNPGQYIGTFQDGDYVLHVFDQSAIDCN